ncbi:hypothetical protein [Taklimakanibacter deserti]|uniref:hypothetical protein n=1 Tax=Taklimakanibacter deserti TaxID=2267839 RepID=UPI000E653480
MNAVRFIQTIVKIAEENSLLILMENGYLIRPSVNGILRAIQKSPAFKFVENPEMFLKQLEQSKVGFSPKRNSLR